MPVDAPHVSIRLYSKFNWLRVLTSDVLDVDDMCGQHLGVRKSITKLVLVLEPSNLPAMERRSPVWGKLGTTTQTTYVERVVCIADWYP